MVCALARQKQLAKFKIVEIFLRLELPWSRQRIAQIQASNLARGCEVAFRRIEEWGGDLDAHVTKRVR